jgi:hypothetical protein
MAKKVSIETGIPQYTILAAYTAYWDFIKETISKYDMMSIESEDDMCKIQDSFNIKHIGKLQTNLKTITAINNKIREKNESTEY